MEDQQQSTVTFEADRSELIQRLCEVCPDIEPAHIQRIVKSYGGALAWLLYKSSDKRVEITNGVIFSAHTVEESSGKGPKGEPYTEAAHLRIETKLHKGLLDEIGALLNIECKN